MTPGIRMRVVNRNQNMRVDQIIEERLRLRPTNVPPLRRVFGNEWSACRKPLGKGELPRIVERHFLCAMEKREKRRAVILPRILQQGSAGLGQREKPCPIDAGNRRHSCFGQ